VSSTKSLGTTQLNRLKQSLLDKLKEKESYPDLESDLEHDKGKQIIDANPNATIATKKIQPYTSKELEEGERLFHSHMWVKGTQLDLIVDNGS
jgi:hypothetical protein